MNPLLIGPVIELGKSLLDKFVADPKAKQEAEIELIKLAQADSFKAIDAQLELARQQNEVNKAEAADPSIFKSGWRPFIGWICGAGLSYQFVFWPFLSWLASVYNKPMPPNLDIETLMTLLFGLLGLGSLRTVEKVKGKA